MTREICLMKKYKNKYTKEKWADLSLFLSKSGCPVQQEHFLNVNAKSLHIQQTPDPDVNMVFDLNDGRTGWVMEMHVRNGTTRPIRIGGVEITAPWGFTWITVLPGPPKNKPSYEYYEFPDETLGFNRCIVINEYLSGRRKIDPGPAISGLLLATSEERIPDHLPQYSKAAFELSIYDEQRNKISSKFDLRIDRSTSLFLDKKKKADAESLARRFSRRIAGAA